ncbi:hypothetical protein BT93_L2713 [Corymbia citriodora subsp. variegata]|uniref:F-box domain-containing protein n=1 Tax=Corymbia citriodora subsp. variegata TaxID=360336 RepID=A0A8T0CJ28_CORYI|nr:hypothetical protein BT93_L2713 [Corymbia citriodora subsp. variegata]
MGLIFSSTLFAPAAAATATSLGDLPESCVSSILAYLEPYLEPTDICRMGRLNRAFRGVSWADFVLGAGRVVGDGLSKREIYTRLCQANVFDGGTKKVWLDKCTSRVCVSIASKGLAITGIEDRRYWSHIPTKESSFGTVAYLQQTWWLQVKGEMEFPFPAGSYSIFFRIQLGWAQRRFDRRICNFEHVHGWDKRPVRFQMGTSDGQSASSPRFLEEPGKWINYHVGDFTVRSQHASTKVKFSMTQIDLTHTKGGLCLDSVIIYPSEYKERLMQV